MRIQYLLAMVLWAACAADAGPSCPSGTRACGSACVNVSTSASHCGACGNACSPVEACVEGSCVTQCPVNQTRCGSTCVDLRQDRAHCGACGRACAAGEVCADGACDIDCGPLTTCVDLRGGAENYYCANLRLDRLNCGACGVQCPTGQLCRGGACAVTCPVGQLICAGRCVDPQSDRLNCGACGAVCASGFECARGRCVIGGCPAATVLCAGSCVDLETDRNHCGACLAQCPMGYLCRARNCVVGCPTGEVQCGDACANTSSDARHCGRCGNACAPGEFCVGGACRAVCQAGQTLCGERCASTDRDNAHCGRCGNACAAGATCVAGACVDGCADGRTRCGGTCTDTQNDPSHCGACGRACTTGQGCVAGACVEVTAVPMTGPCTTPNVMCDGRCVDPRSNNSHCGRCGEACPGDRVCVGGSCVAPCAAGQTRCASGVCSALVDDNANCGGCGNACPTGQFCARGSCGTTPPATRYEVQRDVATVREIDACAAPGASRLFTAADEGEMVGALPFALRYWSTNLPAGAPVVLSVNGFFAFASVGTAARTVSIPSTSAPNGVVAVFSRDLQNVGALCVATVGAAPSRRWVVQWPDAQVRLSSISPPTGAVSMEAIVSERADTIDFIYRRVESTSSGYVGLENLTGTANQTGCPTGTSSYCIPVTGSNVRFAPIP